MSQERAKLVVTHTSSGHVLHIHGRATMRESPAFFAHAVTYLTYGAGELIIDLSGCTHLDSTFLGCLVQLHKRFPGDATRHFELAIPFDQRQHLLAATNLEKVFHIRDDVPPATSIEEELPVWDPDSRDLGQHVMECHRALAKLGGPHKAIYDSIAEQLARELRQ